MKHFLHKHTGAHMHTNQALLCSIEIAGCEDYVYKVM